MKQMLDNITVTTVHALEKDDLFAYASTGLIWAGRVNGVVYTVDQLTNEQRAYMFNKKLDVPTEQFEPVGGTRQFLVFFEEHGTGLQHVYLDWDAIVAVFHEGVGGVS